jgi:hypothetical protein
VDAGEVGTGAEGPEADVAHQLVLPTRLGSG